VGNHMVTLTLSEAGLLTERVDGVGKKVIVNYNITKIEWYAVDDTAGELVIQYHDFHHDDKVPLPTLPLFHAICGLPSPLYSIRCHSDRSSTGAYGTPFASTLRARARRSRQPSRSRPIPHMCSGSQRRSLLHTAGDEAGPASTVLAWW
jgi:hypothetical protein